MVSKKNSDYNWRQAHEIEAISSIYDKDFLCRGLGRFVVLLRPPKFVIDQDKLFVCIDLPQQYPENEAPILSIHFTNTVPNDVLIQWNLQRSSIESELENSIPIFKYLASQVSSLHIGSEHIFEILMVLNASFQRAAIERWTDTVIPSDLQERNEQRLLIYDTVLKDYSNNKEDLSEYKEFSSRIENCVMDKSSITPNIAKNIMVENDKPSKKAHKKSNLKKENELSENSQHSFMGSTKSQYESQSSASMKETHRDKSAIPGKTKRSYNKKKKINTRGFRGDLENTNNRQLNDISEQNISSKTDKSGNNLNDIHKCQQKSQSSIPSSDLNTSVIDLNCNNSISKDSEINDNLKLQKTKSSNTVGLRRSCIKVENSIVMRNRSHGSLHQILNITDNHLTDIINQSTKNHRNNSNQSSNNKDTKSEKKEVTSSDCIPNIFNINPKETKLREDNIGMKYLKNSINISNSNSYFDGIPKSNISTDHFSQINTNPIETLNSYKKPINSEVVNLTYVDAPDEGSDIIPPSDFDEVWIMQNGELVKVDRSAAQADDQTSYNESSQYSSQTEYDSTESSVNMELTNKVLKTEAIELNDEYPIKYSEKILEKRAIEEQEKLSEDSSLLPQDIDYLNDQDLYPESSRLNSTFIYVNQLGSGAFGNVLRVKERTSQRDFAVKTVSVAFDPHYSADQKHMISLLRECRLLSQLSHSNVVRYYASWFEYLPSSDNNSDETSDSHNMEDYTSSTTDIIHNSRFHYMTDRPNLDLYMKEILSDDKSSTIMSSKEEKLTFSDCNRSNCRHLSLNYSEIPARTREKNIYRNNMMLQSSKTLPKVKSQVNKLYNFNTPNDRFIRPNINKNYDIYKTYKSVFKAKTYKLYKKIGISTQYKYSKTLNGASFNNISFLKNLLLGYCSTILNNMKMGLDIISISYKLKCNLSKNKNNDTISKYFFNRYLTSRAFLVYDSEYNDKLTMSKLYNTNNLQNSNSFFKSILYSYISNINIILRIMFKNHKNFFLKSTDKNSIYSEYLLIKKKKLEINNSLSIISIYDKHCYTALRQIGIYKNKTSFPITMENKDNREIKKHENIAKSIINISEEFYLRHSYKNKIFLQLIKDLFTSSIVLKSKLNIIRYKTSDNKDHGHNQKKSNFITNFRGKYIDYFNKISILLYAINNIIKTYNEYLIFYAVSENVANNDNYNSTNLTMFKQNEFPTLYIFIKIFLQRLKLLLIITSYKNYFSLVSFKDKETHSRIEVMISFLRFTYNTEYLLDSCLDKHKSISFLSKPNIKKKLKPQINKKMNKYINSNDYSNQFEKNLSKVTTKYNSSKLKKNRPILYLAGDQSSDTYKSVDMKSNYNKQDRATRRNTKKPYTFTIKPVLKQKYKKNNPYSNVGIIDFLLASDSQNLQYQKRKTLSSKLTDDIFSSKSKVYKRQYNYTLQKRESISNEDIKLNLSRSLDHKSFFSLTSKSNRNNDIFKPKIKKPYYSIDIASKSKNRWSSKMRTSCFSEKIKQAQLENLMHSLNVHKIDRHIRSRDIKATEFSIAKSCQSSVYKRYLKRKTNIDSNNLDSQLYCYSKSKKAPNRKLLCTSIASDEYILSDVVLESLSKNSFAVNETLDRNKLPGSLIRRQTCYSDDIGQKYSSKFPIIDTSSKCTLQIRTESSRGISLNSEMNNQSLKQWLKSINGKMARPRKTNINCNGRKLSITRTPGISKIYKGSSMSSNRQRYRNKYRYDSSDIFEINYLKSKKHCFSVESSRASPRQLNFEQSCREMAFSPKPQQVTLPPGHTLCIQMELCSGPTLEKLLQNNYFMSNPKRRWDILRQCLEALRYVHGQGVIHCDLKPSNLFLTEDLSTVKIGDFGLGSKLHEQRRNRSKRLEGTMLYASPEHRCGFQCRPASDVYSLGVIAFEMWMPNFPNEAAWQKALISVQNDYDNQRRTGVPPPGMTALLRPTIEPPPLSLHISDSDNDVDSPVNHTEGMYLCPRRISHSSCTNTAKDKGISAWSQGLWETHKLTKKSVFTLKLSAPSRNYPPEFTDSIVHEPITTLNHVKIILNSMLAFDPRSRFTTSEMLKSSLLPSHMSSESLEQALAAARDPSSAISAAIAQQFFKRPQSEAREAEFLDDIPLNFTNIKHQISATVLTSWINQLFLLHDAVDIVLPYLLPMNKSIYEDMAINISKIADYNHIETQRPIQNLNKSEYSDLQYNSIEPVKLLAESNIVLYLRRALLPCMARSAAICSRVSTSGGDYFVRRFHIGPVFNSLGSERYKQGKRAAFDISFRLKSLSGEAYECLVVSSLTASNLTTGDINQFNPQLEPLAGVKNSIYSPRCNITLPNDDRLVAGEQISANELQNRNTWKNKNTASICLLAAEVCYIAERMIRVDSGSVHLTIGNPMLPILLIGALLDTQTDKLATLSNDLLKLPPDVFLQKLRELGLCHGISDSEVHERLTPFYALREKPPLGTAQLKEFLRLFRFLSLVKNKNKTILQILQVEIDKLKAVLSYTKSFLGSRVIVSSSIEKNLINERVSNIFENQYINDNTIGNICDHSDAQSDTSTNARYKTIEFNIKEKYPYNKLNNTENKSYRFEIEEHLERNMSNYSSTSTLSNIHSDESNSSKKILRRTYFNWGKSKINSDEYLNPQLKTQIATKGIEKKNIFSIYRRNLHYHMNKQCCIFKKENPLNMKYINILPGYVKLTNSKSRYLQITKNICNNSDHVFSNFKYYNSDDVINWFYYNTRKLNNLKRINKLQTRSKFLSKRSKMESQNQILYRNMYISQFRSCKKKTITYQNINYSKKPNEKNLYFIKKVLKLHKIIKLIKDIKSFLQSLSLWRLIKNYNEYNISVLLERIKISISNFQNISGVYDRDDIKYNAHISNEQHMFEWSNFLKPTQELNSFYIFPFLITLINQLLIVFNFSYKYFEIRKLKDKDYNLDKIKNIIPTSRFLRDKMGSCKKDVEILNLEKTLILLLLDIKKQFQVLKKSVFINTQIESNNSNIGLMAENDDVFNMKYENSTNKIYCPISSDDENIDPRILVESEISLLAEKNFGNNEIDHQYKSCDIRDDLKYKKCFYSKDHKSKENLDLLSCNHIKKQPFIEKEGNHKSYQLQEKSNSQIFLYNTDLDKSDKIRKFGNERVHYSSTLQKSNDLSKYLESSKNLLSADLKEQESLNIHYTDNNITKGNEDIKSEFTTKLNNDTTYVEHQEPSIFKDGLSDKIIMNDPAWDSKHIYVHVDILLPQDNRWFSSFSFSIEHVPKDVQDHRTNFNRSYHNSSLKNLENDYKQYLTLKHIFTERSKKNINIQNIAEAYTTVQTLTNADILPPNNSSSSLYKTSSKSTFDSITSARLFSPNYAWKFGGNLVSWGGQYDPLVQKLERLLVTTTKNEQKTCCIGAEIDLDRLASINDISQYISKHPATMAQCRFCLVPLSPNVYNKAAAILGFLWSRSIKIQYKLVSEDTNISKITKEVPSDITALVLVRQGDINSIGIKHNRKIREKKVSTRWISSESELLETLLTLDS